MVDIVEGYFSHDVGHDAEAIRNSRTCLREVFATQYPITIPLTGDTSWTLCDVRRIGANEIYNTPPSVNQLMTALVLSRDPAVRQMVPENLDACFAPEKLNALIEAKVLRGMRALDLGCGIVPLVARAMRAMGAEVFTVDIVPSTDFVVKEQARDTLLAMAESSGHIRTDFLAPKAAQKILTHAGKPFDYVTTAHPIIINGISGYADPSASLVQSLLAPGGVYYNATDLSGSELIFKSPVAPARPASLAGKPVPATRKL